MKKIEKEKYTLSLKERDFLETLIKKTRLPVIYALRSVLGGFYDVLYEESISALYLLSVEKIKELSSCGNPEGWMVISARNIGLNLKRKRAKYTETHVSFAGQNMISSKDSVFEEVVYNIWTDQNATDIFISTLSPLEKQVYELMFIREMSSREVAGQLKISESTVWNVRKRIQDKSKKVIKEKLF